MIRRLIPYFKPYRGLLLLDLVFALLLAGIDLIYPVMTGKILDDYVPAGNLRMIFIWLGVLIPLYLLKALSKYIVNYYGHMLGVRIQADMRERVFQKLQGLPFSFFDNNKTGAIMSRIIHDLQEISEFCHHGPEEVFLTTVTLGGAFVILARTNLLLTLLIFVTIPLIAVVAIRKKKGMRRAFAHARSQIAEVNADLESSISGIRVSRAFTSETHEAQRFRQSNHRFRDADEGAYRAMGVYYSHTEFGNSLLIWVGLAATSLFAFYGKITPGEMATTLLYVNLFGNAVRRLTDFAEMYERGSTGLARYLEILDTEEEKELPDAKPMPTARGAVQLEDVSFMYEEGEPVLRGVSLDILPGQKVAVVGPSGGGKTTMCHLLPRFYDVTHGRILIDGMDIATVTLDSLRKNIGIVQQDVYLFNGTLRENIAYGDFTATQEQIEQAARRANIHDYIISQPQGYDTQVGERGIRLSGGQKQRIAIARVFLKNPPILILDEATSALDNITEQMIQEALDQLCAGRTTLVVAHRLSTVKGADKIVVLTQQGIEEEGTHQELLDLGGIYAGLYQSQFLHQNPQE